jgi:hypothetical protein
MCHSPWAITAKGHAQTSVAKCMAYYNPRLNVLQKVGLLLFIYLYLYLDRLLSVRSALFRRVRTQCDSTCCGSGKVVFINYYYYYSERCADNTNINNRCIQISKAGVI